MEARMEAMMRRSVVAVLLATAAIPVIAQNRSEDEYTRYELLAPDTASFKIIYDVAAVSPGAKFYFNLIRQGSVATDESVIDLMTGAPLKFQETSGAEARESGLPNANLEGRYIRVELARPVPRGGEGRIRIIKTYKDPKSYYTETREGTDRYLNVVRQGSTVADPSAKVLDTGETLKTEILKGQAIARARLDIGETVRPDSEVVVITFPTIKKGQTLRLRIEETYTDPARYDLIDGQLMWRRSFGRPRNDIVLPSGWYLTTSSIPATISQTEDGRLRLSFVNPRPDSIDVFVKGRRK